MSFIFTRVDQKLIHGQVAVAWVPHLKVNTIIVVDADLLPDPWSQKVMKMGLPLEIEKVYFIAPEVLNSFLETLKENTGRILILFKDIIGAYIAIKNGLKMKSLNLGNQVYFSNKKTFKLNDSFFVTKKDIECLTELETLGIEVMVQASPKAKKMALCSCLETIKL